MRWIDANEKQPARLEDVIVYTTYGYSIAHYEPRSKNWRDENDHPLRVNVTHWAQLPPPPRGKMPQPEPRLCRDCEYWKSIGKPDGTIARVCDFPRSDKFTDATAAVVDYVDMPKTGRSTFCPLIPARGYVTPEGHLVSWEDNDEMD